MKSDERPIGIFDSGVGGLTVLNSIHKILPNENIIYLSDCKNSPYGTKTPFEIEKFTIHNIDVLIKDNCKLIVIACNTATAVCVEKMRNIYKGIEIVGLEPAIRQPAEKYNYKNILILATEVTVKEKRFLHLKDEILKESNSNFYIIPTQILVQYVEKEFENREKVVSDLKDIFKSYKQIHFDACVLGCTHFPFAKDVIIQSLGYELPFFDGGQGSAVRTEVLLKRNGILNISGTEGTIKFIPENFADKAKKYLEIL